MYPFMRISQLRGTSIMVTALFAAINSSAIESPSPAKHVNTNNRLIYTSDVEIWAINSTNGKLSKPAIGSFGGDLQASHDGRYVAFSNHQWNDRGGIAIWDVGAQKLRQVTAGNWDLAPTFAWRNNLIAFTRDHSIMVTDMQGARTTCLAHVDGMWSEVSPAWGLLWSSCVWMHDDRHLPCVWRSPVSPLHSTASGGSAVSPVCS
jgi:hypothetical protein